MIAINILRGVYIMEAKGEVYYTPQGVKLVNAKAFILCNQNWLFNDTVHLSGSEDLSVNKET